MNPPHTARPRPYTIVTYITHHWLEHLDIILAIDSGTSYLMSCACRANGDVDFGLLAPCSMSVQDREAIMNVVERFVCEGEIVGRVHWCCGRGIVTWDDNVARHSAPLDPDRFAPGSITLMRDETQRIVKNFARKRKEIQRSGKGFALSRVLIPHAHPQ